jgi:hypothetical protein
MDASRYHTVEPTTHHDSLGCSTLASLVIAVFLGAFLF